MTERILSITLRSGVPSTDSQKLRSVGELLFGEDWQEPLANALCVRLRSLQRWMSDDLRPMPANVPAECAALCEARATDLSKLAKHLRGEL